MSGGSPDGQNTPTKESTAVHRRPSLPSWLNHFNVSDFKIFTRCCIAAWVAMILTFITPVLGTTGQATFFAALVLFIVPPASILFIYLLGSLSLLAGMCLAWAWGLLTMKAALAVRSDEETAAKLQALQQAATTAAQNSGQSVAWEQLILVRDGFMLDARVTAVFYVMVCVFIYVMARLRCSNPKLTLTQLFGTIAVDIFLLFGPTLPKFAASIGELLIEPGAIGVGIGAVCCLLFFPTSTSYAVLDTMGKLVATVETPLDALRRRLGSDKVPLEQLVGAKARMIGLYKMMLPTIGFLPLDFSRCRWGAEDIKELQGSVREAMVASLSLLDIHIAWVTSNEKFEKFAARDETSDSGEDAEAKKEGEKNGEELTAGHREMMENAHIMEAFKSPERHEMDVNALEALRNTTADLLGACSESVLLSGRCIQAVNSCRWIRKTSQQQFDDLTQQIETTLVTLSAARATCVKDTTEGVLEAYSDIFDENGDLKASWSLGPPALKGIILAMVVEERILVAATTMEKLLRHILRLMNERKTTRMWFPTGLRYAFSWLFNGKATVPVSGDFNDPEVDPDSVKEPTSLEDDAKEAYRRLKLSSGYGSASARSRNALARVLVATYKWLFNPSGMYALRMVIVTIATAIPAAIPQTAGFFYREKGIWAVITAQTAILVYMADFTFSLVTRSMATIIGGVMGMIAWYMGSGNGSGNPYGLGASTALMIFIIMWLRLYLPPVWMKATILLGATFVLVVGFSFDHHHLGQQYGLPGVGYVAFWKRVVTVLIGFAAATVVQIFPRPPSATKHVCKSLSACVRTLSDHYALLLSHWGRNGQHSPLGAVAEEISLDVGESLLTLNEMIGLLQFELTTGPFNQTILKGVQAHCQSMNQALRRLLSLSSSLPENLQDRLSQTFGVLDDRVVGDVMAVLSIVEQSLLTGAPLPERLPTPLIRQFYDTWRLKHGSQMLTKSLVRDENYRRYCVAMSAYLKFLSTIDDLVIHLKQALGECHHVRQWEDA
ncbi:hypothetical protein V2G26_004427 [Clonostachys chloroleuca]